MAKPGRKAKRGGSSRVGPKKAARGTPSGRSISRRPVRIALTAGAAALLGGVLWATLGDRNSDGSAKSRGLLKAGEELYAVHCASCRGANLEGQDNWRTQLPDGAYPAPPHDASGHT